MLKEKNYFLRSIIFFGLFIVFSILVLKVDVKAIGPNGSMVGFASINKAVFDTLGANEFFYELTEYLGTTAFLVCGCFGFVGLFQWIKRKKLFLVDAKIILLGLFYILVIAFYFIFTKVGINYRPILEADGSLEPSFPSSHTVLAVCVYYTAFLQDAFNQKGDEKEKKWNKIWMVVLPTIMIVGRLLSGAHWLTDIIGAVILSVACISLYEGSIQKIHSFSKFVRTK